MVTPTSTDVLKMLRQLPPSEQLRIISLALPEIEKSLGRKARARKSLCGLWSGAGITPKDIAETHKGMLSNFPRSDI
ncbi:MAG TPA: hypothetical protein PLI75_01840 [Anaerolineales bacterium]|nr:hypothetical protein [Anaerolineales bacterium]HND90492.1 hypothetical protein [Anaerolineales bacterium]HNE03554.1 hypothetical protein [Anaerolineales bacterium]